MLINERLEEQCVSYSIHCSCHRRRILVNISRDQNNLELLFWAIAVAARPGDEVIATMHLLDRQESRVLELFEQCKELCHFRQITSNLKALPLASQGIEATLLEQASTLGATMVACSTKDVNPSLAYLKQAEKPADFASSPPPDCSVFLVTEKQGFSRLSDDQCQVSSSFESDDVHVTLDYSPRAVLQGPESGSSGSPSKPLLSPTRRTSRHRGDEEEEEEVHASCLNLFRATVVKRQSTFPAHSIRSRRLLPSFSWGTSQNIRYSNCNGEDASSELNFPSMKPSWKCFTFVELQAATNAFHPDNLVGKGGYAEVYKGRLADGQLIAVKKLTKGDKEQQKEGGFLTELGIIGHVSHPNATSAIGFCVEQGLHLVFPLSQNGSLASVLHGSKPMEWSHRYKVAIGVAKGLHYLHKLCPRRIIHRDIKASNILLDSNFDAQISDFGLAKWLPEQWTHHTVTPIEGTFGYLAPEYFMHGIVDEKTDVFAYGVLLLELISGRKPIDSMQKNIVVWAKPHLESCNIQELVDPKICGAYNMDQMRRLVLTATLCVRKSPLWRPCMNQVLKVLTDEEIPKNWSTLVSNVDDEYTSNDDLNRLRALAFET